MSVALQVPAEYGYVLGAATTLFFVNTYHSFLTGRCRKNAKIAYPTCYASAELADKDPAAFKFNCAQRAHNNYSENLTPLLGELLISGLRYPILSASVGLAWGFLRVMYAYGYVNYGPKGRQIGGVHVLCDLVLKATAAMTAYSFISSL